MAKSYSWLVLVYYVQTKTLFRTEKIISKCRIPAGDDYLAAASPRSVCGRGGVAATLEEQAAYRNACVIAAVIQSGPHACMVPDQFWPVGTRWPSGPKEPARLAANV